MRTSNRNVEDREQDIRGGDRRAQPVEHLAKHSYGLVLNLALAASSLLASGCAKDAIGVQSSFMQAGVAPRGTTDRVAVLDFEGIGGSAFADVLAQELMRAKYNAVERSALRAVVDEREIGSRTADALNLNALRRDVGGVTYASVHLMGAMVEQVDALEPTGSTTSGANSVFVTCRAVDPKSGQVLWTGVVKAGAVMGRGDRVGPLTAWRTAAREIVRAYKEANYRGQSVAFEGDAVPR